MLVSAELPLSSETGTKWPNYKQLDLNCTKYVPLVINPFLDAPHFRKVVRHIQQKQAFKPMDMDEVNLGKLYLVTGGLASSIVDNINCSSEYIVNHHAVSLKDELKHSDNVGNGDNCDVKNDLLLTILAVLNEMLALNRYNDDDEEKVEEEEEGGGGGEGGNLI